MDRAAGGARATTVLTRLMVGAAVRTAARCSIGWSTRSPPETWAVTLSKTLTMIGVGAHELSKRQVRVARWSGDTIGPTIYS